MRVKSTWPKESILTDLNCAERGQFVQDEKEATSIIVTEIRKALVVVSKGEDNRLQRALNFINGW